MGNSKNILPIRPLYFFRRRNSNAGLLVVVKYFIFQWYLCKWSEYFYHWNFTRYIKKKRQFRLIVKFPNIGINNFPQGIMLCLCPSLSVSVAVWAAMSGWIISSMELSFICREMENSVWWDEGSRHIYCLFRKIVQKLDANKRSGNKIKACKGAWPYLQMQLDQFLNSGSSSLDVFFHRVPSRSDSVGV